MPLPPVLTFVFHQGPDAWNVSTAFEDLFELPEEASAALLPFLPKFHHALLDLTRFDPTTGEDDARLRAVLQLMKLARRKELLRFFQWLAAYSASELPDNLLGLMLLFAGYVALEYHRPKPPDWTPTYANKDKIPYGTYVLYDQLPRLLGTDSVEVVRLPVYNQLTGLGPAEIPEN